MDQLPSQKLNPKIKAVWRINDLIWLIIIFAFCVVPFFLVHIFDPMQSWALIVAAVGSVAFIAALLICIVILPPIRYVRWRFDITPEYLDIARGILWRKRIIIPFIRVQNTDTKDGPILRAFGLSSVTVSTAAGAHEIPGLNASDAATLRDMAAEYARCAHEDV